MDRKYLERRIRVELRLARKARSPVAAQAHRELAALYAARLEQLHDGPARATGLLRSLNFWLQPRS